MLELAALGPIMSIFILMGIAGVASYGLVEIAKKVYTSWLTHTPEDDKEKWWWSAALRLGAVCVGAGAGYLLMPTMVGLGLGLGAGVLNVTMVTVVKAKLKKMAEE